MSSYKAHFSHFIQAEQGRLHFAAHSHHYWPDVTRAAQLSAWDCAAHDVDQKWDHILGQLIPSVQAHIARHLGLSKPGRIAFASNTHAFVLRLFSSFAPGSPVRVLSSDSEFHSFTRQCERYFEDGSITWDQVSAQPFDSFEDRFEAQLEGGDYDLVFLSQVFFNSGHVVSDLKRVAAAMADSKALLVIDGYHGFMAIPTDLGPLEERLFYIAGGYKYAMSGGGVCFMHCPDGYALRPANTGWFASFGALAEGAGGADGLVSYASDGQRFWGATMEPSGLFRMRAVFDWLEHIKLDVNAIHMHVRAIQGYFMARLIAGDLPWLDRDTLLLGPESAECGHFLTLRTAAAEALHARLLKHRVITDFRGHNLRFGFGIYHERDDVDRLCQLMQAGQ